MPVVAHTVRQLQGTCVAQALELTPEGEPQKTANAVRRYQKRAGGVEGRIMISGPSGGRLNAIAALKSEKKV